MILDTYQIKTKGISNKVVATGVRFLLIKGPGSIREIWHTKRSSSNEQQLKRQELEALLEASNSSKSAIVRSGKRSVRLSQCVQIWTIAFTTSTINAVEALTVGKCHLVAVGQA